MHEHEPVPADASSYSPRTRFTVLPIVRPQSTDDISVHSSVKHWGSHPAPVTPATPNVAASELMTIQSGPNTPVRMGNNLKTLSMPVSSSALKKSVTASGWIGCLCKKIAPKDYYSVSGWLLYPQLGTHHCSFPHFDTHGVARVGAWNHLKVVDRMMFSSARRI